MPIDFSSNIVENSFDMKDKKTEIYSLLQSCSLYSDITVAILRLCLTRKVRKVNNLKCCLTKVVSANYLQYYLSTDGVTFVPHCEHSYKSNTVFIRGVRVGCITCVYN